MNKLPSNFCPAPWINRYIDQYGDVSPCCWAKTSNEANIATLKKSFLSNEQDPLCSYCWRNENANLHSMRLDYIDLSGDKIEYNKDTFATSEVENITVNLGNLCNAECIMCSEEFSTARETWQKTYNKKSYNIQSAPISDSYFNLSDYKNLKTLTLMGGEPAIHLTTHKILDNFISAGNSKNISISLNTNSSKLDQVLIDKLKLFNVLSVTLSIDSVGKYFEYQRRPLKWNQVKNVANKWMEICDNIVINYVVTAISIWGFNDFIEWFTSFPQSIQNKNPRVIFVHVFTVEYLGLSVLNEDQRTQWIKTAVDHPFKNEIIKIIESTKYDPTLIPILKDNITLEDTTSEIKFAEIFPDWKLNGQA